MFDISLRVLMLPILLAQGFRVRARALRLPEADGPRFGQVGDGPPLSILIPGDSSAAGVGVGQQSQALSGQLIRLLASQFTIDWRLVARTGATTRSTLDTLNGLDPAPFDIIVTALGVNDVTHAVPRSLWLRQQQRLIERLDTLFAPRLIYLSGVPPLGDFPILPQPLRWSLGREAHRFNAALARLAHPDPHVRHVPFSVALDHTQLAEDGYHPGPEIYALWGNEIASRIISDWPDVDADARGLADIGVAKADPPQRTQR